MNKDTDIKDYIETFDSGVATGLGYQFEIWLMISIGFNWSFSNYGKEIDEADDDK